MHPKLNFYYFVKMLQLTIQQKIKKLLATLVTKMVAAGIASLELQEGPSCLVNNWSFRNPQSVAVQARGTLHSWTPEINVEGMLTRVRKDINKSIGHEIKGVKSHKG